MDTVTRLVSIFDVLEAAEGPIKIDEIAKALECSVPTAYRYLRALTSAGLAAQSVDGGYGLGARIIQLDRAMRRSDPFLIRSGEVMAELLPKVDGNLMVCAYYAGNVICIDQAWPDMIGDGPCRCSKARREKPSLPISLPIGCAA